MSMASQNHPEGGGTGIVHIGPGAFHRAHQAVYTQDACRAENDGWRIDGVSLRSRAVADALNAQSGRYTLVVRSETGTQYRTINTIRGVMSADDGLSAIRAALHRPETRIVSLTITEKAYRPHEDAEDDKPDVIRLLTDALEHREQTGTRPLTLLSCDNLADNGGVLRDAIVGHAQRRNPRLADWIAEHAKFPSTMVDRIVPATTPALVAEVEAATGWADQSPVETEAFSQWVIEDDFADGRPRWEAAGAILAADVTPYERMKLRMLNGAHSLLAYTGHAVEKTYVRDVMADEAFANLISRHMDAAAATLAPLPGTDFATYRDSLLSRFRNPHIAHETYQIAMDGSQKLPQRIFAPAADAIAHGMDVGPFAFATAAWMRYLLGQTEAGTRYHLRDPREAELAALPAAPQARVDAVFALPDLLPAHLAASTVFRTAVSQRLSAIADRGMTQAILEELND